MTQLCADSSFYIPDNADLLRSWDSSIFENDKNLQVQSLPERATRLDVARHRKPSVVAK